MHQDFRVSQLQKSTSTFCLQKGQNLDLNLTLPRMVLFPNVSQSVCHTEGHYQPIPGSVTVLTVIHICHQYSCDGISICIFIFSRKSFFFVTVAFLITSSLAAFITFLAVTALAATFEIWVITFVGGPCTGQTSLSLFGAPLSHFVVL